MLDINKPIQTKDGRQVRIICTDYKDTSPIIALISYGEDKEAVATYTLAGKYWEDGTDSPNDLVNIEGEAQSNERTQKREIVDFKLLQDSDALYPAIIALSNDKKLYMLKNPGDRTSVTWEELPALPQD
jgi:hypothetical protein